VVRVVESRRFFARIVLPTRQHNINSICTVLANSDAKTVGFRLKFMAGSTSHCSTLKDVKNSK